MSQYSSFTELFQECGIDGILTGYPACFIPAE